MKEGGKDAVYWSVGLWCVLTWKLLVPHTSSPPLSCLLRTSTQNYSSTFPFSYCALRSPTAKHGSVRVTVRERNVEKKVVIL